MMPAEDPLLEYYFQKYSPVIAWIFVGLALIACLTFIVSPADAAPIINPSVENQPWYCQNYFIKGICEISKPGPQGPTGIGVMNQTPGPMGPAGVGGGQVLYFHHDIVEAPAGYEGLQIIPAGSPEEDETLTIKSTDGIKTVDPYITLSTYPATTTLPAGLWRFRTFHYVDSNPGETKVVFTVYNYTTAGVMTKLFDVVSEDINALAVTEYLTPYVQQTDYTIANTDRIVINVSANTTSASNKVFHFVYEGSLHTSHVQTPLPLSYTQGPMINESYAYLPGRQDGQVFTGSSTSGGKLYLNGSSSNNGEVRINPNGGKTGIGYSDSTTIPYNVSLYGSALTTSLTSATDTILAIALQRLGEPLWIIYAGYPNAGDFTLRQSGVGNHILIKKTTGYISIGQSASGSPTANFQTVGTNRFSSLGAGTLTTDTGGNITAVSDEKFKTNILPLKTNNKAPTTTATQKIMALNPVCWNYNTVSGLDTQNKYCGFLAQDIEKVIPEAVYTKDDTKIIESKIKINGKEESEFIDVKTGTQTHTIDERGIIDTMVLAMQEQQTTIESQQKQIEELKTRLNKAGI